jgi:hypothetical protein
MLTRSMIHATMVAEHARETPNNICNQSRHRQQSNPIVKLITLERLGLPKAAGVVIWLLLLRMALT